MGCSIFFYFNFIEHSGANQALRTAKLNMWLGREKMRRSARRQTTPRTPTSICQAHSHSPSYINSSKDSGSTSVRNISAICCRDMDSVPRSLDTKPAFAAR